MSGVDSTPPGSAPAGTTGGQTPIVVHSKIHGDVADWHPSAPVIAPVSIRDAATDEAIAPGQGQSPPPPELAAGGTKRAFGLDALRGLFLLSMTAGFTIGAVKFPTWMYHRQQPFDAPSPIDVAGISWRDLAYASFLFTMAAALPLTLSRKIDKGELEIGIIAAAIRRYFILLVFAILIGHSNTFFLGYTQPARVLSIVGFVIMAMVFTRRRADWSESRFRVVNRAGWLLAIAFLALTPLTYGKAFSPARNDDIIVGLAFASLFGSLIWYFTRENLLARLGLLGLALALYLGAKGDGWIARWWWDSPAPWLFAPQRFVLMAVVIPGTIAGDVILRWMRSEETARDHGGWRTGRVAALTALCLAFTPLVTAGLYNRWVGLTTGLVVALLTAGFFLTWRPLTAVDRMLRSLFLWGGVWLVIGLFIEPFEGGIKKLPDTLSYFFTVTGTTSMLLVALTAIIDSLGRQKWVATLIDLGHNPLMLYVLFTILINSTLELIPPMRGVLRGSPGEAVVRSLLEVTLVVVIVTYMSRKRIYWRT